MSLPDGLLEAVKNYLDITWDDPDGDNKLSGIIMRGMQYLNKVAGQELDYTAEDKPRELLWITAAMFGQTLWMCSKLIIYTSSYRCSTNMR